MVECVPERASESARCGGISQCRPKTRAIFVLLRRRRRAIPLEEPKASRYLCPLIGVKLVIDLAREGDQDEAANVEAVGMKFVRIPLSTTEAPPKDAIDKFLRLVNDPANQPVYVHCMGGRHRTGAMTPVYRMTQNGWTADQAFAEMKQYRFGADFLHPELKKFVYAYFSGFDKTQAPKVLVAAATPAVP